jgi:hypothetical protein
MSCDEIHVGDVGTSLRATIYDGSSIFSLSSATVSVVLVKPDGTKVTKAGSLVTDGTDGLVEYITVSGDLDQAGIWEIQAIVTVGLNSWRSEISRFKVKSNL